MNLTKSQKQEVVTKIKQSNTFSNARTNSSLLQYLHDSTLKGGNLKEEVIDIEFYGKSKFTDKNNPRVRVNVYNLRKKLIKYYEEEGKDDKWQLSIQKGQYQVSFIQKETGFHHFKHLSWSKAFPYAALLLAIFVIAYTNTSPRPQKLWRSFLSSTTSTHLYVGDAFGAVGSTITGGKGFTRDYSVNNFADFYELINSKPELKDVLEPSPFTYTNSMAVISVQRFQHFFQAHKRKFAIRFSTRTSTSDIKEGNAIYIGTFTNNNQFLNFFNEANPYCKIENKFLHLSGHPIIKDYDYNIFTHNEFQEYAIVSKYPATVGTEHIVFFSQHDIGVTATVDYFTNADSIKNFTKTYLKNNKYFTAIFKVKGQDRINTNLHLETVVSF